MRVFGNAACAYVDVTVLPLTDHDWQLISFLQRVKPPKNVIGKARSASSDTEAGRLVDP